MKPGLIGFLLWAAGLPAALASESVTFPGGGLELPGRLYRPAGEGRFPAVVLLHGCSGMWLARGQLNRNYDHWAKHLQARGFVAVLVDSFGPRGEREICTQRERRIQPSRERVQDARAALRWLASRPDVDKERIHVLGWSNGATTALHAIRHPPSSDSEPQFRSAVAFYPGCRSLMNVVYRPAVPLFIATGAADDWTPAVHCEALAEKARMMGAVVEIQVHADAHHAFDAVYGAVRFRPDVSNPASPTGRGATVGPEPRAREAAWRRATEFLENPPQVPRGTEGSPRQLP